MDLRTGRPIWLQREPAPLRFPRRGKDLTCDVAVIGAGITGALVMHQLIEAGLRVIVIDRRTVAAGSTAASTGLLLYETDTSLAELTRLHDAATGRRVYQLGRRAIRELGRLGEDLIPRSEFRKRPTLYVASTPRDMAFLASETRRLKRMRFPATLLDASELWRTFHFRHPGALRSTSAAEVNPFELARGVFRHHRASPRLQVFEGTTASRVSETEEGVTVRLSNGTQVQAGHVVVAAGYESRRFIDSPLVRLHSTYVIASPPLAEADLWPHRALMWETARPYFYLRTTTDNRIIFGGLDEPFANARHRDRLLTRKKHELEKRFAELFPALAFKAAFAWTGTFAETSDGLPCIGPAHPRSRVLYALGYGGNGITFSQIAARLLRDVCLGRKNPDLRLFRFDRSAKTP